MNDNELVLDSVLERDIDLLLVEELNVSSEFAHWFIAKCTQPKIQVEKVHRVLRSVSSKHGETDILISFETSKSTASVLLVENKISAPPQPEQAERYRQRGEHGLERHGWDEYHTCIIAPSKYLTNARNTTGYLTQVSYEEIRDWFATNSGETQRGRYRASIIDEAINQNRRGYTPQIDEQVSRFWNQYWRLAASEFPELNLKEPNSRPAGSLWMQFPDAQLPEGCRLQHKADRGVVHLELRGRAADMDHFAEAKHTAIPDDIEIVLASKSLALSINVPPINHAEDFESQIKSVRDSLEAAARLVAYANSAEGRELIFE
ncbi:MAG: PD-(D/E)XK nuclease family protein [Phycisphaerales bacterium JB052]